MEPAPAGNHRLSSRPGVAVGARFRELATVTLVGTNQYCPATNRRFPNFTLPRLMGQAGAAAFTQPDEIVANSYWEGDRLVNSYENSRVGRGLVFWFSPQVEVIPQLGGQCHGLGRTLGLHHVGGLRARPPQPFRRTAHAHLHEVDALPAYCMEPAMGSPKTFAPQACQLRSGSGTVESLKPISR